MENQQTLVYRLYQIGAIKLGEFTLKSGQTSKIYLDLRQIISHPDVLRAVANVIWQKIRLCQFDMVCGIPYTALPIATGISLQHNIPMIMRRKEKKEYGTKQTIEGKFQAGQRCLIIEDVITTGGSILETTAELETAGLKITDLAVLIDREQGGKENLEKNHYKVHAVFTLSEIIKILLDSSLLTTVERTTIETLLYKQV